MKRLVRILFMTFALSLLGFLMSCSSENTSNAIDESHSTEQGEPTSGGTLNVAYNAEPDSLDWMYTGATSTRDIAWHIFEPLFALDHEFHVRPMIAEDFDVSEDAKTYTITIRNDVQFHNGEPVLAEDVIASMDRWFLVSSVGKITKNFIEEVREVNEHTIEIKLNTVYNSLLDDFAAPKSTLMILPKPIAEEAGEEPLQTDQLIGTGPYAFQKWDRGHEIILTKFQEYTAREEDWGGLTGEKIASFDEIVFQIVKDPQVGLNGVKTGLYDYAQAIAPDLLEVIETDPTMEPVTYIDGYSTITPNKAKEPFSDIHVRRALHYGINQESISQAVYGHEQFYGLDGALFDPEQTALYSDVGIDEYFVYDPEKAKELLDSSDYNGEPLTVIYANNYPEYEKIGEVMKQQLEEVGFSIDLVSYEWATYLEKWQDPENWHLVIVGWSTRFSPNELGMLVLGESSSGFYESERWEELLVKWGEAEIGEEREEILGEMNRLVWEELPFLKVANVTSLQIQTNSLTGHEAWIGPRFWNMWKEE